MNHPFVRKRSAFVDVFLRLHGRRLDGADDWLHERLMAWIARRAF